MNGPSDALQRQVQQLLNYAREHSPDWRGEWSLLMRPETLCLLAGAVAPGELEHPTEPMAYAPIKTMMFDGAEVAAADLRWDIVIAAPGLGAGSVPATYWLELRTGDVAEWTEAVYGRLGDNRS